MTDKFEGECCPDMIEMKQWVEGHEKRHSTIDDVLDKLINRLPLWASVMMTISGGVIGSLLTIIAFLVSKK